MKYGRVQTWGLDADTLPMMVWCINTENISEDVEELVEDNIYEEPVASIVDIFNTKYENIYSVSRWAYFNNFDFNNFHISLIMISIIFA